MDPQRILGQKNYFNPRQLGSEVIKIVDPELKTHHMKFCAPTSKGGGAMGPKTVVSLKKRVFLKITHLRSHSSSPLGSRGHKIS